MTRSRRSTTTEVTPQSEREPHDQTSRDPGNAAAVAELLGEHQGLLNEHATGASVTADGTLKGGLVLGEVDGNTIQTQEDTRVSVGVARWGAWVDMSPALHIRPGNLLHRIATGGITVRRVQLEFRDGKAKVWIDTGRVGRAVNWVLDIQDRIAETFESSIQGALPSDLAGFDPFTDPDIAGRLARVASSFSTSLGTAASGAGDLVEQISDPSIGVSVNPREGSWSLDEGLNLSVGQRASVRLSADMAGSLKDALEQPQVERLRMSASDLTVEHQRAGALASIRIRGAVLNPDLSLASFDYDLSTESILGGLKALGLLLQLRSGQDLGIRDMHQPRLDALREMIDAQVRERVPELLREQVLANRGAIPGLDLGEVLPGSI